MKIAIIGAGFTGLSAALALIESGNRVVVFEKNSIAGGIASGFKAPGWKDSVENFYHHWFKSDSYMWELTERLGVRDKVIFRTPKSVMYHNGKFYPFDSIPAALLYPGLGYGLNKIRFGFVGLYLRLTQNWRELEKVTAREWMLKHAGEFVYETMWEPMMIGKFGERYADKVNMAWLWARISKRTTSLGTYEGGFQAFIDTFVAKLKTKGVIFRFGADVREIKPEDDGTYLIRTEDKEAAFDKVLVTASPNALVNLVPTLPEDYRTELKELKSMGAIVLIVSMKHPLSKEGYYWYNLPKNEGFPCLSLVEHTNFVPKDRFNGETIVYVGDYLETDHEFFSLDKEELLTRMMPAFEKINPDFRPDWIIETWKMATSYGQPIPFLNQSERVPTIETPFPGLYFASMSHIYPYDRGTNFAIELGARAAQKMM